MSKRTLAIYYASENFIGDLKQEILLKKLKIVQEFPNFFLVEATHAPSLVWEQDMGDEAQIIEFESITAAAKKLKEFPCQWSHWPYQNVRRGELILGKVPKGQIKTWNFPDNLPKRQYGTFSLLSEKSMLITPKTLHPLPMGLVKFHENKEIPPSRAYLKLWEFFLINQIYPKKNSKTLDMGSCPGGWTWVLHQLGTKVFSIDRSPLDPKIAQLPNIDFKAQNAFTLDPNEVGPVDWFCSDIICYPDKLYDLVTKWMDSGLVKNFVCTIKFQSETDFVALEKFSQISGSKIQHLYHNKHEVTWSLLSTKRHK